MKRMVFAATALVSLAACGTPSAAPVIVPFAQIDQAKWHSALAAVDPSVIDTPDYQTLYDNTVKNDCNGDVSTIGIALTLSGAMPDVDRVDMEQVCPTLAHKIDDALKSDQAAMKSYNDACAAPPSLRTQAQQQDIEAIGPCP